MVHLFRYVKPALAFALVLTCCSITALAQTQTTGAIQGEVREEAAATQFVPKATVKIRNENNGLEVVTLTDGEGRYRIDMLPPGTYTASATHPDYEQVSDSSVPGILIYLSQNNVVKPPPIILRRRGATPVTPAPAAAGAPLAPTNPELLINITNATRGGNFDEHQLTSLPLPGIRSFESLTFLLPGVALPPQPIGSTVGPGLGAGIGTAGQFSVNGQRARANNFTVDGSDNNDEDVGVRRQGFVALVPQSIESVQEFQVFTHLWESWVGRNLGSQVNAVSKSGTNQIHGTLYGFFNESALNARNFFDYTSDKSQTYQLRARVSARLTGLAQDTEVPVTVFDLATGAQRQIVQLNPSDVKDQYRRAQGGAALGFPIIRDKAFLFGSFERQDIKAQQETHFAVPTVAQRGFLGSGAGGFTIPGLNLGNINPIFRPTFLAGDDVFSLFPFPNNPVGPYGENTFTQVLPADANGTIFSLKFDYNFKLFGPNVTHTFTSRYNFTNDERKLPAVGDAIFSSLEPHVRTQNLSLFLSSQLTPSLANQIRVSYGRTRLRFDPLRDPSLLASAQVPNDPRNGPFLLNARELANISCTDNPALPVRARAGCFNFSIRNPLGFYLTGLTAPGTAEGALGSNGLGPVGQVIVEPFSPVGLDPYSFPQGRVNNTYQFADTLTLFRGGHTLKFGADTRRTQFNSSLDRTFRSQVIFGGTIDSTFTTPDSRLPASAQGLSRLGATPGFFSGSDLAALGIPTGIFQSLSIGQPDSTIGLRFWQYNFFFNDNWRIRRGLTLDYGLRYEYNTVPREAHNRIENTFGLSSVPANNPSVQIGTTSSPQVFLDAFNATVNALKQFLGGREQIYEPDRDNFGPHFGFAWDPLAGSNTQAGKMVIRGGGGLYYDVTLGSVVSQSRNVFPNFLPINADLNLFGGVGQTYAGPAFGFINIYNLNAFALSATTNGQPLCFNSNGTPTLIGTTPVCFLIQPGTLNVTGVPAGALQQFFGRIFNTSGSGRLPSGSGLAFTLPDRNLRSPYAIHFNLQIERELFRDFLANVAYVGSRGLELTRFRTPNGGLNSPTSLLDPLRLSSFLGINPVLLPAVVRPPLSSPTAATPTRPIAALGAYTVFDSSASSIYHSLQASVTKRFSKGWQFTAAYNWSHAIDDVSDVFDLAGAFTLPQDDRNLRAERGNANFDVRHRFVMSSLANVPFLSRFNSAGGFKGALLGGWQTASITTYQTGQPYTVNTSFDVNGDGNLTDRINTTSGLTFIDDRQQKLALAASSTSLLAPIGTNGRVGRNTFRASGIVNTDFTLIKNFRLKEGQSLVFRAEAFNFWNRTHFGIPVRILEAPSFGRSVSTSLPARQIQFALKYVF